MDVFWRKGLSEDEAGEVRALLAAATARDGVAPVSEDVVLHLRADTVAHLLVRDGGLAGFAAFDGNAELAVDPAHRRRGVGTRIVGELIDRAGGAPFNVWAHGRHPGAVALAQRFGFTATRELWQMRRSLAQPLPEPVLPAGISLRPFVIDADEEAFLRVNNAAFDWHPEQGGWGVEQVQLREAEPWFDPAGFLLAVDGSDTVLGYHWTKVHPRGASEGDGPVGEVYVLGVSPEARGLRLGQALTLAGLRHLQGRGLPEVLLYVESDNHAAIGVYEALGFVRRSTDVSFSR